MTVSQDFKFCIVSSCDFGRNVAAVYEIKSGELISVLCEHTDKINSVASCSGCRQIANGTAGQLPYVDGLAQKKIKFGKMSDLRSRYYLRITTLDKPGVLARITGILGRHHVSLASVHQDTFEDASSKRSVPIILLTHTTREADIQASVREINRLPSIKASSVLLRME